MSRHVQNPSPSVAGKKLVAVTFDDGPSATVTPQILDTLASKGAVATFFVLGNLAVSQPAIVQSIYSTGNEVASHTMSHTNLTKLDSAQISADFTAVSSAFNSVLGCTPALTRPPYGNTSDVVRSNIPTPLIGWSVDPQDWQNHDASTIVEIAMSQVQDGAIILLHDIYPTTAEALPILIDTLRQNDYELVTVSELASLRHQTLEAGKMYYRFLP